VITVSDTRTLATDTSGALAAERLTAMGHTDVRRLIVTDDIPRIRAEVTRLIADPEVAVILLTGGTGITRRDVTPEAIAPLATRHIPGFGELFRWLSFADIGTSALQSRADAWLCQDTLVFALPGSTGAVELAMDRILSEQLDARHKPCNFIQLLNRIR
ncbi:MAG: molybdenum cofactor biosynthesis protein, partial [Myxococcales bacterium]|nr:molybdenum cofactor biosynthesis protein [Myxococcales bacterium]